MGLITECHKDCHSAANIGLHIGVPDTMMEPNTESHTFPSNPDYDRTADGILLGSPHDSACEGAWNDDVAKDVSEAEWVGSDGSKNDGDGDGDWDGDWHESG